MKIQNLVRRIFNWKRYRTLSITLLVVTFLLTSGVLSVRSQLVLGSQNNQSTELIQAGKAAYKDNKFEAAFKYWTDAEKSYQRVSDKGGISESRFYQFQALKGLGLYSQACSTLISVIPSFTLPADCNDLDRIVDGKSKKTYWEKLAEEIPKSNLPNQVSIWHGLGESLRLIGDLEKSKKALEKIALPSRTPEVVLSLANTERALGNLERDRRSSSNYDYQPWLYHKHLKFPESEKKYLEAEKNYKFVIDNTKSSDLAQFKAKLNCFSLLVERAELSSTNSANSTCTVNVKLLAIELIKIVESSKELFPTRLTEIYARISIAKNLAYLKQALGNTWKEQPSWQEIHDLLRSTLPVEAERLKQGRSISHSFGNLGGLYEYCALPESKCQLSSETGKLLSSPELKDDAEKYTKSALFLAQPSEMPDVAYQWQWQLGRLSKMNGDQKAAIDSYDSAIKTLESVRGDLLSINSDVQFSFRDNIEPLYRNSIKLLLEKGDPISIEGAIQKLDGLQLAELENFLRCNLNQTVQINNVIDNTAARIYPVILEDRVAVILQLPKQPPILRYPAPSDAPKSSEDIDAKLKELRAALEIVDGTPQAIPHLKTVYNWLIKPISSLIGQEIKTLVFLPDASLRNIPMAALVKEQKENDDIPHYLIEDYSIVAAPRLKIFRPKQSGRMNLFLGGFGSKNQKFNVRGVSREFKSINKVEEELNSIRGIAQRNSSTLHANSPILNEYFTKENLDKTLRGGNFSAIHFKTHGDFDVDPEGTFVVASDELIKGKDLVSLIQTAREGINDYLELIVLSACSTAKGTNRSVFGLAGIAAKSGARSALSTLWEAQNEKNTEIMVRFYTELAKSGTGKAQALQSAQLYMIRERGETPYVWANYVLVGNWL